MEFSNGTHPYPRLYDRTGTHLISTDSPGITAFSLMEPVRQTAYRKIIQAMQLSYQFSCLPEHRKEQTGYSNLDFTELTYDVINRQAEVLGITNLIPEP